MKKFNTLIKPNPVSKTFILYVKPFVVILLFLFTNNVLYTQTEEVKVAISQDDILSNSVNEFSQDKVEVNSSGWHYFFTNPDLQKGWYVKMSYVEPNKFKHAAHIHSLEEIFYILEGTAEVTINQSTRIAGPNTSVYCPANTLHGIKNAGNIPLKYLVIKKQSK